MFDGNHRAFVLLIVRRFGVVLVHQAHQRMAVRIRGDHGVAVHDFTSVRVDLVVVKTGQGPQVAISTPKSPPNIFTCCNAPIRLVKADGRN
jgi:hypothetical protein